MTTTTTTAAAAAVAVAVAREVNEWTVPTSLALDKLQDCEYGECQGNTML